MGAKKEFDIHKTLKWLKEKHLFLDLFEATGFFLKQQDTRVEIQFYCDPTAIAKTTLMTAVHHANEMEGEYVVRKRVMVFTPKSLVISADNLGNAKVSEKELNWLLDTIAKRRAKDPTLAFSFLLLIEFKVSGLNK